MTAIDSLVVAFTGHRPERFGGYGPGESSLLACSVRALLAALVRRIALAHPEGVTFLSGMAQGVDTWAAEAVVDGRTAGLAVRLIATVPFEGQERVWPEVAQQRYREVLSRADEVVILARPTEPPTREAVRAWFMERNRWMIDRAALVVAVFDGSRGGTAAAVHYAEQRCVPIVRIDPARDLHGLVPTEAVRLAQEIPIPAVTEEHQVR